MGGVLFSNKLSLFKNDRLLLSLLFSGNLWGDNIMTRETPHLGKLFTRGEGIVEMMKIQHGQTEKG